MCIRENSRSTCYGPTRRDGLTEQTLEKTNHSSRHERDQCRLCGDADRLSPHRTTIARAERRVAAQLSLALPERAEHDSRFRAGLEEAGGGESNRQGKDEPRPARCARREQEGEGDGSDDQPDHCSAPPPPRSTFTDVRDMLRHPRGYRPPHCES